MVLLKGLYIRGGEGGGEHIDTHHFATKYSKISKNYFKVNMLVNSKTRLQANALQDTEKKEMAGKERVQILCPVLKCSKPKLKM